MTEGVAWAIFFLPLGSFVAIAFVVRPFLNRYSRWAGYLTIAAVGGSFALSLWALVDTIESDNVLRWTSHSWMTVGALGVRIGILMDSLTAVMVVVVTGVSLMVQVYSQGYMRADPGYARYYAYMSLFTASMLGLVMASSILQLYVFWELVGLSSYLLIGFWYHRPAAARAAVKAFLVTRLGDLGLLLAILVLFFHQGTFSGMGLNSLEIVDIHAVAAAGMLGSATITWVAIGIFAGAVGKSAQFPLHVWLPDAMEGPTPVSALIHAATMVVAGIFLVARFFPVFEASDSAMNLVAIVGGVTAIFAATMGMVMYDIKRVVAYSTISQLGYMMLALGIGAYAVAIFHLFTHAFFKALLFLGAGSVNHATGTFDMRYMGGLRRYQPWTYALFLTGAMSLAGIFPLAGFWSKDEILAKAWANGDAVSLLVFALAIVTVFLTAFYIFRVLFMTFHGEFRGGIEVEERAELGGSVGAAQAHNTGDPTDAGHGRVHLAESPWVMVLPMLVLGVMAVVAGVLVNPPVEILSIPKHWISEFLVRPPGTFHSPGVNVGLAVISVTVALAGVFLAWLLYGARRVAVEDVTVKSVHKMLTRKYYMDDLYEHVLTDRLFYRTGCALLDWFDRNIVDEIVEKVGWFGRNIGRAIAQLQTGQLQTSGTAITVGIGIIVIAYSIWG